MHNYQLSPDQAINVPVSWDEITVGQFEKIRSLSLNDSESKLISTLTKIPSDEVDQWDMDQVDEIMEVLTFLSEKIDPEKYPLPETIVIDGKEIKVKVDVRIATIDQRWTFERRLWPELKRNNGVIDTRISEAIAVYLQPQITGKKFDDDNLQPCIELINELPILVAYPIAYFFTNACVRSLKKRETSLKNRLSRKLNELQASIESQDSETSIQSTPLQMESN